MDYENVLLLSQEAEAALLTQVPSGLEEIVFKYITKNYPLLKTPSIVNPDYLTFKNFLDKNGIYFYTITGSGSGLIISVPGRNGNGETSSTGFKSSVRLINDYIIDLGKFVRSLDQNKGYQSAQASSQNPGIREYLDEIGSQIPPGQASPL